MKLTRTMKGKNINIDVNNLYGIARDLPYLKWNEWLNEQFNALNEGEE